MRYATCGPQWVSNRLWLTVVGAVALTAGIVVPIGASPASATGRSTTGTSAAAAAWPEVPELRTATSQTYRGPNGQLRTELHAAPINYRTGKGWQKIDSRLVAIPLGPHAARDGVVDEYAYHNAANAWQTDFKNRLTDGFLRLSVQGQPLTFDLAGASPSTAHVSGSAISYPQVFDGTDLQETVTPAGVKESLTLGSARAPARYTFTLTTPAAAHVTGRALPDGGYEFGTTGGSFVLSPPFAVDAAQVRAAGGRLVPASDGRHAKLQVSRHGTDWTIAVTIDQRWLSASGRSFPVTVDPSITLQSYQGIYWSFAPTCDSTCTGYPGSLPLGNAANVILRAGLQFDLAGVPAGANVTSATLSLYHQSCWGPSACGSSSQPVDVHRMTSAWTQATASPDVTFDATPSASTTIPVGGSTEWDSWDLTSVVKSWAAGTVPNYGLLLKRSTEPTDAGGPEFVTDQGTTTQPKLDVLWASDAVLFPPPEGLHANGAELRWERFDGSTGASFDRYEIHRSQTANFTPSASTLIATIRDPDTLTYRDTTAAPGHSFSYQIVTNGTAASVEQRVTLPPVGTATMTLQPDNLTGKDTVLVNSEYGSSCGEYGGSPELYVGTNYDTDRSLLRFDVSDIPAASRVSNATLSLYANTLPGTATTVQARAVTSDWQSGSGWGACGSNAANWTQASSGHDWLQPGGDFDSTVVASKSDAPTDQPGWDPFDLTTLAQQWVDGTAANFGVLLKASDETAANTQVTYESSDSAVPGALRPKLAVSYAEPAQVNGPQVAVSSPATGAVLSDTQTITATASDDSRVARVDFYVDGVLQGSDSTPPYSYAWATVPVADGQHTLSARATDDAGNVTASTNVTVQVANSAPPQTAVTVTGGSDDSYSQAVLHDTPSAYWRLGDTSTTATDASGNGRNGTYVSNGGNLVNLGQSGLLTGDTDEAAGFYTGNEGRSTGPGDSMAAAIGPILAGPLTVEAWANFDNAGEDRIISRNWGSGGGWLLSVRNVTGQERATFSLNNGGTISSASSAVTTGKHYLAGTWDGTTTRLYVDGIQTATATPGAVTLNTTASVIVGGELDSFYTVIDEVALYPRALSAADIGDHFATGSHTKLTGDVPVDATASDDGSVAKVEFYLDGNQFGESSTAPYTATLKTLDPAAPAYDGIHTLTTTAYDNQGKVTESAPIAVETVNAAGTPYQLALSSSDAPQAVSWDSSATTQQASGLSVHLVNTSSQTLNSTDVVLRYRWLTPDPTAQHIDGPDVPLPADLAPGGAADVTVDVPPPALPDGVDRAQYDLQIDAYQRSTATYFAAKGNPPIDNPVIVDRLLNDDLGLERWFHYEGEDIGAGMQHIVNVSNGNSLLSWSPWQEPGRGLATTMELTYNSLEKKSESPVGNNFSLSISSLTRWGNPLDIHPNKADSIAGQSSKYIDLVDGDGTTHRFTGHQAADGSTYWTEPAGVHLYLRHYSSTDATRAWALSRPDRTTFFYNDEGYPTSVTDANGNTIAFTETAIAPGEDPGGPDQHVTKVTDAAGRSWNVTYYTKSTAKKPQIRGKISQITDHNGDALRFDYYEDGNLLRITQAGGHNADGSPLSDRSFVFTYTTSNGDAPAIPNAADRVNPAPKTSDESTRLYSLRDPLGHETTFEYLGPGNGQDRWKLAGRTDRDGTRTTWSYDTTNRITTQTAPLSRVTTFGYDTTGRLTSLTNPNNEKTTFAWTADNAVNQITEPNTHTVKYQYNDNGYLTTETDEANHTTEFDYQNVAVDGSDVTGKWLTGRTIPHYSQLHTLTRPRGVATSESTAPADYEWLFSYDSNGNLLTAADPEDRATNGKLTSYGYNPDGTVHTVTDPNGHVTTYDSYDGNGLPTSVTDADGQQTLFSYDAAGQLQWLQDGNHPSSVYSGGNAQNYRTYFYYDSYHRQGSMSEPKSSAARPGVLIWTGINFDPNDNVLGEESPHEGTASGDPGTSTVWTHSYDAMDRVLQDVNPDKSIDAAGERTQYRYDDAGRLVQLTSPNGLLTLGTSQDNATFYDYDSLDRVTTATRYEVEFEGRVGTVTNTLRTFYCYDIAGDLRSVTSPNAHATSVTCAPYANASNTTKYDYAADHRLLQTTDPDNHVTSQTYDEDGNVASYTDALRGRPVLYNYNERDQLTKIVQPFDDSVTPRRDVTSQFTYDPAGNVKTSTSPRGSDAGNGDYVTSYGYDAVNQPTLTTLPKSAGMTQLYVHQAFDANGNQTMVSQPVRSSDPTTLTSDQKTTMQYYDTGWLLSLDEAGNVPKSSYDYTSAGWQSSLTATGTDGSTRSSAWTYYSDGTLKSMTGQDGQQNTYNYDEDNNLTAAKLVSGSQGADGTSNLTARYDSLDRLISTDNGNSSTSNTQNSEMSYDDDNNVTQVVQNTIKNPSNWQTTDYFYTPADRVDHIYDHGKDSALSDDRRVSYQFFDNGLPQNRTVEADGNSFTTKQTTAWTWFLNGQLKTLVTKNGAGTVTESHALNWIDSSGNYANDNPVQDAFRLTSPGPTNPCQTSDCTVDYTYDGMDRLTDENRKEGTTTIPTHYTLDDSGNIEDSTVNGVPQDSFKYSGNHLDQELDPAGQLVSRYLYDAFGNLSCVTTGTTDSSVCKSGSAATPSPQLRMYAQYDPLNRMQLSQSYDNNGQLSRSASYTYDALDRPMSEDQTDTGTTDTLPSSTTTFSYLGLSNNVNEDQRTFATGTNKPTETHDYSYGALGERVGLTFQRSGNTAKQLYYGHDAHGSISQLLNDNGDVQASYAYQAYGSPDSVLTSEEDPDTMQPAADTGKQQPEDPINSYRWDDKRIDPGSGTLDMGARRYSPTNAQFLQMDNYAGALDNLNLEQDTLTQNRYGFAGGNPVSYIDQDGHMPIDNTAGLTTSIARSRQAAASGSSSSNGGGGSSSSGGGGSSSWTPSRTQVRSARAQANYYASYQATRPQTQAHADPQPPPSESYAERACRVAYGCMAVKKMIVNECSSNPVECASSKVSSGLEAGAKLSRARSHAKYQEYARSALSDNPEEAATAPDTLNEAGKLRTTAETLETAGKLLGLGTTVVSSFASINAGENVGRVVTKAAFSEGGSYVGEAAGVGLCTASGVGALADPVCGAVGGAIGSAVGGAIGDVVGSIF